MKTQEIRELLEECQLIITHAKVNYPILDDATKKVVDMICLIPELCDRIDELESALRFYLYATPQQLISERRDVARQALNLEDPIRHRQNRRV